MVDLEIIKEHKFASGEIAGYAPLVPLFGIWIKQNVEYDELVKALEDQIS